MFIKRIHIILLTTLALLFSGCVTSQYTHKSFEPQEIGSIVVLPFMDNRKNADPRLSFEEMTTDAKSTLVTGIRYTSKYRSVICSDIGNVSSYSVQDLPTLKHESNGTTSIEPDSIDSEWIKQLGPSTERWVLVPVLEGLSHFNVLVGQGGIAEVSLYLFDKQTGMIFWYSSARHRFTMPILLNALVEATMRKKDATEFGAIEIASGLNILKLPKRNEPFLLP